MARKSPNVAVVKGTLVMNPVCRGWKTTELHRDYVSHYKDPLLTSQYNGTLLKCCKPANRGYSLQLSTLPFNKLSCWDMFHVGNVKLIWILMAAPSVRDTTTHRQDGSRSFGRAWFGALKCWPWNLAVVGGSSWLGSVVRITPIYKPYKGHLEGEQPHLGD